MPGSKGMRGVFKDSREVFVIYVNDSELPVVHIKPLEFHQSFPAV